jgi:hypothetical protein
MVDCMHSCRLLCYGCLHYTMPLVLLCLRTRLLLWMRFEYVMKWLITGLEWCSPFFHLLFHFYLIRYPQFVEHGRGTADTPGVGDTLLLYIPLSVESLQFHVRSLVKCSALLFTEQVVTGLTARRVHGRKVYTAHLLIAM